MIETIKQPTVEEQLKYWLSYLERGVHSGNREFDAEEVANLLKKYKQSKNPDQEVVKDAERLLNSYKEWKATQIEITPDNDYT